MLKGVKLNIPVWGHRGCRGPGNPPENSLAAFREAQAQGAVGVEFDVFLTRDGRLIVFHDAVFERMTNGSGNVAEHTLAELQPLRLKTAEGTLSEERIPTLEEVLDLFNAARDFTLNIELKGPGTARPVAEAIGHCLKQGWDLTRFLVSSFNPHSLREVRAANPAIPIGVLFAGPREPWNIDEEALARQMAESRDIQPQTIGITLPSMSAAALKRIADAGARPIAWTSGEIRPDKLSPAARNSLLYLLNHYGITLITDYPREMLQLLANR